MWWKERLHRIAMSASCISWKMWYGPCVRPGPEQHSDALHPSAQLQIPNVRSEIEIADVVQPLAGDGSPCKAVRVDLNADKPDLGRFCESTLANVLEVGTLPQSSHSVIQMTVFVEV